MTYSFNPEREHAGTKMIDAAFLSHGDFILTKDERVAMVLRKQVRKNRVIIRFDDGTDADISTACIERVSTNMEHVNAWRGR